MWVAEDEPRLVVARKGFESRKGLFTIFFNCEGPVLVDILPRKPLLLGPITVRIFYPAWFRALNEKKTRLNIFYCLYIQWGWAISSHNISYSPPPTTSNTARQRPTTGIKDVLLHHDNASPHKAKIVKDYSEKQELQVLPHLPFSPDLAPYDFWLFPTLKERLTGRKFYRMQDLAKAVFSELRSIPKEDCAAAMEKWIARRRTCIKRRREYFEGM